MTNKCHIKHKLPANEFNHLQIGPIGTQMYLFNNSKEKKN